VAPDAAALGGNREDVVRLADLQHADDGSVAPFRLDVDDALAPSPLEPVFLERRALAEAALGDREDRNALLDHLRRDDLIVVVNVDAADPARRAPHGAHLLLGEPDDHARLRGKQDFALTVGAPGCNDLVALVQRDGEDAPAPRVRELAQLRLLHRALLRGEEDVAPGLEVAHGDAGGYGLALGQREHVHDGLALGLAPAFRNLVHLEPVHLALVREEEQVRVGGGDEEVLDDVLFLRLHAGDALAPTLLAAI